MLSPGAFNALLKTLEEPPEHVKFILATTEPQKLPATILSRCQRFDFKRISNEDIIKRLKVVCNESNIEITDSALNIIAVLSEGAMRDALSILERCIQDGENKIDEDKIKDLVGIPKIAFVNSITEAIIDYDIDKALKSMDDILNEGKDLNNFLWEIIKYIKDILIYKSSKKADLYSEDEIANINAISEKVTKEKLVNLIYSSNIEERVDKIEKYLKSGRVAVNTMQVPVSAPQVNQTQNYNLNNRVQSTPNVASNTVKQNTMANKPKQYSNDLSKSWPTIVNDLKQNGKIVLYTNLMNTSAEEINDMTVGIKFPNGLSSFGKTVLEKQENIKEISTLVSMACGKEMQIKYISENQNQAVVHRPEDDIQKLANQSDIPFNVIE